MPKTNLVKNIELPVTISDELREIQSLHGGSLRPRHVVEYARNPETLLHSKFEWDDSIAGQQYRLWQARQVIRLELIVVDREQGKIRDLSFNITNNQKEKTTRAFISLTTDRKGDGSGYRNIEDILTDEGLRQQLLNDAKNDMNLFRRKYSILKELAIVFEAMDKV